MNFFVFLLLSFVCFTQQKPEYLKKIPNAHKVVDACSKKPARMIGHDMQGSFGALNQFGKDFKKANFKWTVELCNKDSDNDGLTNGQELGDPNCVWPKVKGSSARITHPGIKNDCGGSKSKASKS